MSKEYRFEVALSFAGDGKRELVRKVAELLGERLGKDKVFFDEWYEAELAGHDAHLVLQNIYGEMTRLVVVGVCDRYDEKPWTQEEWRVIQALERNLRDAGKENVRRMRLLPLRFADGKVSGVFSTAIIPDVRTRTPEEIAKLILDRLNLAKQSSLTTVRLPENTHFAPEICDDLTISTDTPGQHLLLQGPSGSTSNIPVSSLGQIPRKTKILSLTGAPKNVRNFIPELSSMVEVVAERVQEETNSSLDLLVEVIGTTRTINLCSMLAHAKGVQIGVLHYKPSTPV